MTVVHRAVPLLLLTLLLLPLLPPSPAEPAREPGVFEFDVYLKAPGDPWHVNVTRAFYNLTHYRCELPNVIAFERIDEGNWWRYRCIFNSRNITRYAGTAISSLTFVNVTLRNMTYYRYDFVFPKEQRVHFYVGSYSWGDTYAELLFVFPAYNATLGNITHVKKQIRIVRVELGGYEYNFDATLTVERVTANHLRIILQRNEVSSPWADYIYVTIGTHRLIVIDFYDVYGGSIYHDTWLPYHRFNRVVINIYLQG